MVILSCHKTSEFSKIAAFGWKNTCRFYQKVLIFGSRSKGTYREGSDIDLAVIGDGVDYNQILTILCEIDDLELLYSIDLLDYNKKKGTPIGDHIDRVGQIFYEAA